MTFENLEVKEKDLKDELFWLNIKHRSGQLTNFSGIKKVKKDLARVKTFLRSKREKGANLEGVKDEKTGNEKV